ncbi:hypothetical protein RHMOL_Rhmol09G0019000 [Rhododendron molle]|uniref:Uncharacterized protein n=1 Tax=Rhododendron molle TaxID=49168 RepID=A0ACC0M9D2_RHOML|nr:hypothetical protein RHMOL_Rhmol09G0019000 [Rhododendron molle]
MRFQTVGKYSELKYTLSLQMKHETPLRIISSRRFDSRVFKTVRYAKSVWQIHGLRTRQILEKADANKELKSLPGVKLMGKLTVQRRHRSTAKHVESGPISFDGRSLPAVMFWRWTQLPPLPSRGPLPGELSPTPAFVSPALKASFSGNVLQRPCISSKQKRELVLLLPLLRRAVSLFSCPLTPSRRPCPAAALAGSDGWWNHDCTLDQVKVQ